MRLSPPAYTGERIPKNKSHKNKNGQFSRIYGASAPDARDDARSQRRVRRGALRKKSPLKKSKDIEVKKRRRGVAVGGGGSRPPHEPSAASRPLGRVSAKRPDFFGGEVRTGGRSPPTHNYKTKLKSNHTQKKPPAPRAGLER